jgi:hypothetical protein
MGEDKPLFPLLASDGFWKAGDAGWMWQWIQSKHRDRNITVGSQIIEMELSRVVNGGNWMIYIGRKEHVATAHLFRWDDQDRSRSWKKVAERDFRFQGDRYKLEKVIPKAAIWAEEIMYPADKYLYLKAKQNPASDWTLISTRPSVIGKTYSYRNKLKPKYVLALKVRRVGAENVGRPLTGPWRRGTQPAPKTYTTTVVLYSGTKGGPEDATELLVRVGELDEVWTTKIKGKPGVLSSFKYPAMEWADDILFSPDEYLYLKAKQNPSDAEVNKVYEQVMGANTLVKAQRLYVLLGTKLGRPEYPRHGAWKPRTRKGYPPTSENFITREESARTKGQAISERRTHKDKAWRKVAYDARRELEKRWGGSVRIPKNELERRKKKVKVTLSPQEQTAAMIKRLTASQAKDDR